MAKTAAMTISSATAKSEQKVTATCTVTNGDTGAVNVTSLVPTAPLSGGTAGSTSVALGAAPLLPGMATSVAGSNGTLALSFDVVAHSPITSYNVGAEPNSFVYDIGATVGLSDGTTIYATTTTLTVSNPAT